MTSLPSETADASALISMADGVERYDWKTKSAAISHGQGRQRDLQEADIAGVPRCAAKDGGALGRRPAGRLERRGIRGCRVRRSCQHCVIRFVAPSDHSGNAGTFDCSRQTCRKPRNCGQRLSRPFSRSHRNRQYADRQTSPSRSCANRLELPERPCNMVAVSTEMSALPEYWITGFAVIPTNYEGGISNRLQFDPKNQVIPPCGSPGDPLRACGTCGRPCRASAAKCGR